MTATAQNVARHWLPGIGVVALSVVVLGYGGADFGSVLVALVMVVLGVISTPLIFPASIDDARAQQQVGDRTLIYWRPGCSFCVRLRLTLGSRARRAVWVDVSRDPEASARVRSVNDGNETVPTVFTAGEVRTNPSPAWVRATL